MDELLSEFLTETNESLSTLDLELVKLEQNPDNPGLIDNIFRLVHTIKGTCGFLGLPRLEAVAHASENVLGKIRDNEIEVTPAAVSLILTSLDRIKGILAALEASEAEPAGEDGELIGLLNAMALGQVLNGVDDMRPAAAPEGMPEEAPQAAAMPPAPEPTPEPASEPAPEDRETEPDLGRPLLPGEVSLEELERVFQETNGPELGGARPTEAPAAAPVGDAKGGESSLANQSIRVSVELLENLMTMVSELVLTRNQLLQMVRSHADSEFKVPLQRLSHVTTELQEGVMKTRMQPIGNAWAKLPRIIRDLSLELGKKIDLQMVGADTELDRQVLELIKDPLTHMVRNSADHGLERPEERAVAGKPETGRIVLNAYHEGGHIVIEIKDDGRGLDVARIREKVIEKGLATEAELESMPDQQIQQFIFKPGFSTAETVTSISGRGVGMDVVRTNIERIGGTIDLKSVAGKGSTFTIKIPLTLAIVSALIVECGGQRFAIPQISVLELVRASKESEHRIETINATPVLRLRNRLLPLVYLGDCLKLPGDTRTSLTDGTEVYVVVAQVANYSFGIVVDRVFDTEEIVVKPVAPLLRDIAMFSGNTILGDGSVIMILDPNGIAAATSEVVVHEAEAETEAVKAGAPGQDKAALLVFRAGGLEPKAVPLALVARLEDIDTGAIEHASGRAVVQYRGKLMPLIQLAEDHRMHESGRQPILVFADGDRSMGLVVDEIVDIIEDHLDVELTSDGKGCLGSAVIAGKATEVIDVGYYLSIGFADWFKRHGNEAYGAPEAGRRVLLVDDSPFFRNMLAPLLEVAGYSVTTAEDAGKALGLRDQGADFDVIISDIEMPGMNGFDFAAEVRRDLRWQATPMVALSSHTNPKDFERGREVGFSDYVPKFDREALLHSLDQTLSIAGGAA